MTAAGSRQADRPDVLVVTLHRQIGGIARTVVRLADGLAARGASVTWVALRRTEVGPIRAGAEVRHHEVGYWGVRATATLPLARYLHDQRPRAVLAMGSLAANVTAPAVALAGRGVRLVVSERTNLVAELASDAPQQRSPRLGMAATRWAWKRADAIVAVSDGVGQMVRELVDTGVPITSIPNALVVDGRPIDRTDEPAHAWIAGASGPTVVSVGRLSPQKDQAALVAAAAHLPENWRVGIVGDGPLRDDLANAIAARGLGHRVRLLGSLADPLPTMAAADVVAHTAAYEGLANVVVEALSVGTPVVAVDCAYGPAEIAAHAGEGVRLIAKGDPERLAAALVEVVARDRPITPDLAAFELDRVMADWGDVLWPTDTAPDPGHGDPAQ